jgi:hypothetical protein
MFLVYFPCVEKIKVYLSEHLDVCVYVYLLLSLLASGSVNMFPWQ